MSHDVIGQGVDVIGQSVDVLSVPEAAGREALARLLGYGQPAVAPGPVALSAGGRVLFYVAGGGKEDLPELLEWLDWGGVRLDLAAFTESELTDPPVRWLYPAAVPLQGPAPALEATEGTRDGWAAAPDTSGRVDGAEEASAKLPRRASYPTPGLPEPPELIALLATIAAACHRLAVAAAR